MRYDPFARIKTGTYLTAVGQVQAAGVIGLFWSVLMTLGLLLIIPLWAMLGLVAAVFYAALALNAARILRSPRRRRILAFSAIAALLTHAVAPTVASPLLFGPPTLLLAWRALRA